MKILFFITRADTVGGVHVHVRDLAKTLIQQGHKILVVTGVGGVFNRELEKNGIENIVCETLYRSISFWKDWQSFRFLKQIIRQFQPNLISTHSSKAGIIGRLAAKSTKTPCLFTVHGWAFTEGVPQPSRQIYRWLEQLHEPLADKIICVSEHDRLIGIEAGMNPSRLITIHNGMPNISPDLKAKHNFNNVVQLVMVARFEQQKDHLTLLKAFEGIGGAELIFVGDGSELEKTKSFANQIGVIEQVKFLGFCQNVSEIIAQADIFILISNWEGLPRTIIEAMRAELPVIASDVGGIAEMVIDGVTGYCIPRGDVNLLRQRLKQLIEDAQLRQEMGLQGRKRYESEFQFQQMYQKTFTVYQQVIN